VIAINEKHLKRLLTEYVGYYYEDRTHLERAKGTPAGKVPSARSGRILSRPRLGGLHHRYDRAA
jgi:putative transposase